MRMALLGSTTMSRAAEQLAEELVMRWGPLFVDKSWAERLRLLNEVHEQLQEDLGDLDLYSEISPLFIRKLIVSLKSGPVQSIEQAQIYANSADELHRREAGAWLARGRR